MVMMVVERGAGGDGGVGDDMGEGMQCDDHPYRNNPGGICAFCLQEKLGKLVSSSKSIPSFPVAPSSSSSSPSFSSEGGGMCNSSSSLSLSFSVPHSSSFTTTTINNNNNYSGGHHYHRYHSRRARMIPFLSHHNDKAKKVMASSYTNLVLERSKSSSVPRRQFFDADEYSPRKKGFWSFFNLSNRRRSNRDSDPKPTIHPTTTTTSSSTTQSATSAVAVAAPAAPAAAAKNKGIESSSSTMRGDYADDDESPNSSHTSSSSFGRKVARSRSVGCGSRSFSGDFLERISTGFGDCTLRRVESHRETKPKPKIVLHHHRGTPAADAADDAQRIKDRVKCGGIFGGFSSSYWQSSSAAMVVATGPPHSRSKSWGWAFASPMRAFTRPSTKPDDKDDSSRRDMVTPSKDSTAGGGDGMNTTTARNDSTPNLASIPSLLSVRG